MGLNSCHSFNYKIILKTNVNSPQNNFGKMRATPLSTPLLSTKLGPHFILYLEKQKQEGKKGRKEIKRRKNKCKEG
jgi:hypothetical protein